MLCVSAPKDLVFISTMNLDGETNLKERILAVDDYDEQKLKSFEGEIICDAPHESLDIWNGNIHSS